MGILKFLRVRDAITVTVVFFFENCLSLNPGLLAVQKNEFNFNTGLCLNVLACHVVKDIKTNIP